MTKKFVVGILLKDGKYLAEKRHEHERYYPGKTIFPGGHIELNESSEKALAREMEEELGIFIEKCDFVGEFYYEDGTSSKVYVINQWRGNPEPKEAKGLMWIEKEDQLSNEIDKQMLKKIKDRSS
ncbi:MAG: NUDIX domain-containing protein [bacterium]|nr:NUDIX domain-containing protein [bacterium]